ncbi:MAG: ATP-dependent helicase HrpB [Planctomycetota bacterium]
MPSHQPSSSASLPIAPHLPSIVDAVRRAGVLLLAAPPGTGKTTLVPGALRDGGVGGDAGEIVVLEPRRLAAREAARRVAFLRGGEVGGEVGYQVRHDRRTSAATRIRFVTEGILVRQLVEDPTLDGVACVVLDEFHERHVEGDLALAMLKEVRATVRPDLALLVMSATLEVGPLRAYLQPCAEHHVEARVFPVETAWLGGGGFAGARDLAERVRDGVRLALAETAGDVLVFLPGAGEIGAAADSIEAGVARGCEVLPLHGQLEGDRQDRALRPSSRRKVVLATNVAETSLTIEGVSAVVDSGFARVLRHDPGRGLDALRVERISRASAEQRKGRAGRTGPGRCYRLWGKGEEVTMAPFTAPEIRRIDLAGPALEVRAFAGRDPAEFDWLESPDAAALQRADELLLRLRAVDTQGRVTATGRAMLALPLHPRLARTLVEARALGCEDTAVDVVALLAERELGRRGRDESAELPCDVLAQRELWREAKAKGFAAGLCRALAIDADAARAIERARAQFSRRRAATRDDARGDRSSDGSADEHVRRALLAGFPDRVASRADARSLEAVLVGGRGLTLPASVQAESTLFFLALRVLETRGSRSQVSAISSVDVTWLHELGVTEEDELHLDAQGRVVATRRVRYLDLPLSEVRVDADPEQAAALLGAELARDPWAVFGEHKELRAFVARLRWLREAAPDLGVPEFTDAEVAEVAAPLCLGARSLRDLRDASLQPLLEARLPPAVRGRLGELAPARIKLPSGRHAAVHYDKEQGPTVASRLQDFFGLRDTPRIANGRVPLCLQLLAPNQRPVQVTRDLASFWTNIYPKVRNELRRRYPRHAWPEDPLQRSP